MKRILKKLDSRKFFAGVILGIIGAIASNYGVEIPAEFWYTLMAYIIGESSVDASRLLRSDKGPQR